MTRETKINLALVFSIWFVWAIGPQIALAANVLAAFILPTAGTGVNGPSITSTWNAATYQAPVQASIVEPEAGHIGNMTLSTSYAVLTGCSNKIAKGAKVTNRDAAITINVSAVVSPSGTQIKTIKSGETLVIEWANFCSLFFASASGAPVLEWIAY